MKIEKIDHISFAVKDLEETKRTYKEDFGLIPTYQYIAESEKIKVARYVIGEVAIEFMEPTAPDGKLQNSSMTEERPLPDILQSR